MNTIKFFIIALVAVFVSVLMTACGAAELYEADLSSEVKVPVAFIPTGEGKVDIIFDDDSRVPYQHSFELSAEAERRFKGAAAVVCIGEDFKTASDEVTFTYNVCENNVKVNGFTLEYSYKGKTYTLGLPDYITLDVVCRLAVEKEETTPSFYAESVADYSLLIDETKLASAATRFVVAEDYVALEFDHVDWTSEHVSFRRSATLLDGVATVLCNNNVKFTDIYTDGSKKNEEVPYISVSKFNVSVPAMEVKTSEVVGKSFNFNNEEVTVSGYSVKVKRISAVVEGKVMHGDKDYASEITPCRIAARTITFISTTEAVIRFYDDDANDYAEVTVPVQVSEKVTLKNIARDYMHIAYNNAVVSGQNIAIPCDNEASFIKEYSNGSKDAAVKVNYPVVNNYSFNVPVLVVENLSGILNKPYTFNNGTAVVAGKNVTVSKNGNPVVADIMFEGKNYKNEAPKCEVVVKTITFTSATTATITFEGHGETISAIVPVSIVEAESINGKIVAAWATDSYNGRTFVRTDLHVLAELNGAYVVYSRQNRNEAWDVTNLSAAEGQAVLNSGRALAWIWNGNQKIMGTVSAIASESAGYIIRYYMLDGQLANGLGKAESTLNGKKFGNPIHGVASVSNGMWTIAYNGTTYYFVSNN